LATVTCMHRSAGLSHRRFETCLIVGIGESGPVIRQRRRSNLGQLPTFLRACSGCGGKQSMRKRARQYTDKERRFSLSVISLNFLRAQTRPKTQAAPLASKCRWTAINTYRTDLPLPCANIAALLSRGSVCCASASQPALLQFQLHHDAASRLSLDGRQAASGGSSDDAPAAIRVRMPFGVMHQSSSSSISRFVQQPSWRGSES
jgi:hypothetical protein